MSDSSDSTSDPGLRSRDSGRSSYLQVRTLVEHLREQHRRLHATYRAREHEAAAKDGDRDAQRAALVCGYVARHEEDLAAFLDRFSDEERERILDTWLQYGDATSEYDRLVDEMVSSPPPDGDEARTRLAALDRARASLYQQLEAMANAPGVSDFFRRLHEVAVERAREHAEQLPRVEDL